MAIALINQKSSNGERTRILNPETAKERSKRNQDILIFTCTAFFLFAMAEVVGALVSNSLSLLGDAGAMSIDVFTVCRFLLSKSSVVSHLFLSSDLSLKMTKNTYLVITVPLQHLR